MPGMSRWEFLELYDLQLDKEFEAPGQAAQWAPGTLGPRFWGEEDAIIELPDHTPPDSEARYRACTAIAVSPDDRFLAIASYNVIEIYDAASKTRCSELIGHLDRVTNMFFASGRQARDEITEYVLVSAESDFGSFPDSIIVWTLDTSGQPREDTPCEPIDVEGLTDRAMASISETLSTKHGVSTDEQEDIKQHLLSALRETDAKNRAKHLSRLPGRFPSFGTYPLSSDGRRVVVIDEGTGPGSRRGHRRTPHLVVYDVDSRVEICRLSGHTDGIMWAGWSNDDETIATACWDGTFKLWNARTGECQHTMSTGRQNWSGALSPDGSSILLSGTNDVAIYRIATGEKLVPLQSSNGIQLAHWIRSISWHPQDMAIALENEGAVLIWEPWAGQTREILRLSSDDQNELLNGFAKISSVKWADNGRKLMAECTDDTVFVWDMVDNVKWRLQRPKGTPLDGSALCDSMYYLQEQKTVVSLDGDRKVRFWKL